MRQRTCVAFSANIGRSIVHMLHVHSTGHCSLMYDNVCLLSTQYHIMNSTHTQIINKGNSLSTYMYILTKLFTHSFRRFLFPKTPDLSLILIPPHPLPISFHGLEFQCYKQFDSLIRKNSFSGCLQKDLSPFLFLSCDDESVQKCRVTLRRSFVNTLV